MKLHQLTHETKECGDHSYEAYHRGDIKIARQWLVRLRELLNAQPELEAGGTHE